MLPTNRGFVLGVDTVMRGNEIRGEYRESSHVWLPSKLPFRDRAYIRYTHSAPFHSSGCHANYHLEIESSFGIPMRRHFTRLASI